MNSTELDKIGNKESLAGPPDEHSGINFIGVLLVGLTVNLGVAIFYISTFPEAQSAIPDKTILIHNQKP